ncbi:unknown protein [Seminavis robusta]|uniref:Uncharacterized protein n=1 Tax=Seminavis robusta TaxID=568900 RepID=A0A9N8ED45_9STRA|nr:unknown protein [Seminavis robusta]|eukprot:Sro775_g200820.1 n/a (228) ;mRNA; f:25702-26630
MNTSIKSTQEPLFVKCIFDEDVSFMDASLIIDLITLFDNGDPYAGKVGTVTRNRAKALLQIERDAVDSRHKLDQDTAGKLQQAKSKFDACLAELIEERLGVSNRSELPPFAAALGDEIELVYRHKVESIRSRDHLQKACLAAVRKQRVVAVHQTTVARLEDLQASGAVNKSRVKEALADARVALAQAQEDLEYQTDICSMLATKKKGQMQVHKRPSLVGTFFKYSTL